MSIEKRPSGRWRARVTHRGKVVADKTFDRKKDAELWEAEQRRSIALGSFVPPAMTSKPLQEVVAAFLQDRRRIVSPHAWRTDRDNLAHLPARWMNRPAASITSLDVQHHLADQLTRLAPSTVARARTSLSALFSYAVRQKYIATNPVRGTKMPTAATRPDEGVEIFTPEELAVVLRRQRAVSEHLADVTEFASEAGLRWAELRALRVRDLQQVPLPAVRVFKSHSDGYPEKDTKNHTRRTVPLTNRAWTIARAHAAGRPEEAYLFTTKTGKQLRAGLFYRQTRWHQTTVRGLTFHATRHYWASRALAAGIPVNQVARWGGWKNPAVLLSTYAHVLGHNQEMAAIKRLNDYSGIGIPLETLP